MLNALNPNCANLHDNQTSYTTYPITYKSFVEIEQKNYVLVVSTVENGRIHGHTFGCRSLFILQKAAASYKVVNHEIVNDPQPIMDQLSYEIVEIGRGKYALLSIFQSTGNHHYEKNMSLLYIKKHGFDYLLNLPLEYDNAAWNAPQSTEDSCNARKMTQAFEIIKTEKTWYDITVIHRKYSYTQNCEEAELLDETNRLYRFVNDEYIELKK